MVKLLKFFIDENIVTDLKSFGINLSRDVINAISAEGIDIQNSNIQVLDINRWQDAKNKIVLVADDTNKVIAIYNKDRFIYNPNRIKVSDLSEYFCYEVIALQGDITDKRKQRTDSRKGLVDLKSDDISTYNKPPKSIRYALNADYDVSVNRDYYTTLLYQNKLDKYASQLDSAYDTIEGLISFRRRERTTGKKGVYTNWIKKLATNIENAENQIRGLDKNFNADITKLTKTLKTLANTVKDAEHFMEVEKSVVGKTKKRDSIKPTRW